MDNRTDWNRIALVAILTAGAVGSLALGAPALAWTFAAGAGALVPQLRLPPGGPVAWLPVLAMGGAAALVTLFKYANAPGWHWQAVAHARALLP